MHHCARSSTSILVCLSLGLAAAACAAGDRARPAALTVERDTLGDTVVVRTVAGSVWGRPAALEPEVRIGVFQGEDVYMLGSVVAIAVASDGAIYAMDGQVPALRKYDADGHYLATFGREGGGPGEYRRPDGGLVVLPDGRVVLRDPANARLQVYSATGEPLESWPIRGNFSTSNNMVVANGRVYTQILLDPEADVADWRSGLVGYDTATGDPVDTVAAPTWDFEPPQLRAESHVGENHSVSINGVPFAPGVAWEFSPLGYMVGGVSTRYVLDEFRPDSTVLRIERSADPVPVQTGERADEEAAMRWQMRRTQPDWKWNGPPIPGTKPPFNGLYVGAEGRLWVMVPRPAERIPDAELDRPASDGDPDPRPVRHWREKIAFDVFESDGTYLGHVRVPEGFSTYPRPVFRGDRVWAVIRDSLDVQYLTRFRLIPPGAASSP